MVFPHVRVRKLQCHNIIEELTLIMTSYHHWPSIQFVRHLSGLRYIVVCKSQECLPLHLTVCGSVGVGLQYIEKCMYVCMYVQAHTHSRSGGPWLCSRASHTATRRVSCTIMSLYFSMSPGLRTCSHAHTDRDPIMTGGQTEQVVPSYYIAIESPAQVGLTCRNPGSLW